MRNYYCYWCDEPYYGIDAHWGTYYTKPYYNKEISTKTGRERLIFDLKSLFEYCDKYDKDYQKKYLPASEFKDFIDALSNNLNGEDLYKNFCINCEYIDNLMKKVKSENVVGLGQFYPKSACYGEGCSLRVFNKNVNNFLKDPKDFEIFIQQTIYEKDIQLYCLLFDDEQAKQNTIKYYEDSIRDLRNSIKYHSNFIKEYKKKIQDIENKMKGLKDKI